MTQTRQRDDVSARKQRHEVTVIKAHSWTTLNDRTRPHKRHSGRALRRAEIFDQRYVPPTSGLGFWATNSSSSRAQFLPKRGIRLAIFFAVKLNSSRIFSEFRPKENWREF